MHAHTVAHRSRVQALAFNYFLVWTEWYSLYIIFVPVFMFLLIPFRMELTGETKGFLRVRCSPASSVFDCVLWRVV